jgi:hypothetical protein
MHLTHNWEPFGKRLGNAWEQMGTVGGDWKTVGNRWPDLKGTTKYGNDTKGTLSHGWKADGSRNESVFPRCSIRGSISCRSSFILLTLHYPLQLGQRTTDFNSCQQMYILRVRIPRKALPCLCSRFFPSEKVASQWHDGISPYGTRGWEMAADGSPRPLPRIGIPEISKKSVK